MLRFCIIDPKQSLIYVKKNNVLHTVHTISVKPKISPQILARHFELQTFSQNF